MYELRLLGRVYGFWILVILNLSIALLLQKYYWLEQNSLISNTNWDVEYVIIGQGVLDDDNTLLVYI